MKILRIRLSNLNSLKGTHELDLTAEPLASAGLFAITGPTGAGKSTLLDAVTLALYGKAARYGNESNPEHVMSRHCGECSAEVEFEVSSGIYRAVWERHRAGKKASGNLQQPKRYIYDAAGEPLAQQIREAEQKIEDLLGLNYDRFLRSVLLAQGDFARFLKAKADERAELLESLTGTAIYSRLGRLAHTEASQREVALTTKVAIVEQIAVLESNQRLELEGLIKQGDEQREKLKKSIDSGAEMLGKISSLEDARKKEREARDEQTNTEAKRKSSEADLERFRLHLLTVPFAGDLATLKVVEDSSKSTTKNLEKAKTAYSKATSDLLIANHLLRASTNSAVASCQREAKEAEEVVIKETKTTSEARSWLDQHKPDAALADQVGDLAAAIGELKNARSSISRDWTQWKQSAHGVLPDDVSALPESLENDKEAQLGESITAFIEKAGKKQAVLEAAVKEAIKQLSLRKDHLDKAILVAKLEDHRHTLKTGEHCPLCGALEHPYAEGEAPGTEFSGLQAEVNTATEQLETSQEIQRFFAATLKQLSSGQNDLAEGVRRSDATCEQLKRLLEPLAILLPAPGDEDELRSGLQKRDQAYRAHLKEESDANTRKANAENTAKNARKNSEDLQKKLRKLPALPAPSDVGPITPENLSSVPDAEDAYTDAVTHEKTTTSQLADRTKDAKEAAKALAKVEQPLNASVADSEFETLDNLRSARLSTDTAKEIEALDGQLKERATAAKALTKQALRDIAKLLEEKVIEGQEAEAFRIDQGRLKQESDNLLEEQATRRSRLKTDDDNKKLRREQEKALEEDLKALVVWRRLRELIGSHDGSKFRRYAQSISLDILTRHANRHLAKLSDRYLICRDEEEDEALNLQIEDLHQAGVKRPMASLSGGESFLVSLALALGLSDLAGRTVRIDSLFVDEGFGSLDPETLEVAISALESLRQDHKTVGVISHVALLKERIATQIIVEKNSGGVSRIRVTPENRAK